MDEEKAAALLKKIEEEANLVVKRELVLPAQWKMAVKSKDKKKIEIISDRVQAFRIAYAVANSPAPAESWTLHRYKESLAVEMLGGEDDVLKQLATFKVPESEALLGLHCDLSVSFCSRAVERAAVARVEDRQLYAEFKDAAYQVGIMKFP
jgi:hypothetical protein